MEQHDILELLHACTGSGSKSLSKVSASFPLAMMNAGSGCEVLCLIPQVKNSLILRNNVIKIMALNKGTGTM